MLNPTILATRPLTREDLAHREPKGRIARLRSSHHIIARLVASGLPRDEVAERAGCTLWTVSNLQKDPAFIDLVAQYRNLDTEQWLEKRDQFYDYIYSNGLKAQRQISDALDDAEASNEPLPLNRLLAIAADSADRVGYMKKSANVNFNVDFAKRLEDARRRVADFTDA